MTLPVLPLENEDPWFEKRNAFDVAVKSELEGRLSEAQLSATIDATTTALLRELVPPITPIGIGPVASRTEFAGAGGDGRSNGTDTYGNYRSARVVRVGVSGIRLLFTNFNRSENSTDNAGLTPITVRAALETGGNAGGTISANVQFKGASSVTIPVGGYAISDPFGIHLSAGDVLYVRTNVTVAAGGRWPISSTMPGQGGYAADGVTLVINGGGGETGTGANVDKTLSGSITGTVFHYPVAAILGTPDDATSFGPVVGLVADSKGTGSGDATNPPSLHGLGYFRRTLGAAGIAALNIAVGGTKTSDWIPSAGNHAVKLALLPACKHVIVDLGTNDFNGGRTWAVTQPNMIAVWNYLKSLTRGNVYATTVIPSTTSTDAWATLANQTPRAREADRVACNTWLRDGAPLLNGAAVAVGSNAAGTLRIGQWGHPVAALFDFAAATESALNSGKLRIDLGTPTTDGVHPSTVLHKAMGGVINTALFV